MSQNFMVSILFRHFMGYMRKKWPLCFKEEVKWNYGSIFSFILCLLCLQPLRDISPSDIFRLEEGVFLGACFSQERLTFSGCTALLISCNFKYIFLYLYLHYIKKICIVSFINKKGKDWQGYIARIKELNATEANYLFVWSNRT